ncbi:LysR family transcriptional regulator [Gordonia sp. CPCC 205515]|uniref:LysR family transcriptional regulator n=1 Tax=Gordonia sp. CPCC 205515 TaxID=3140791 RepID=UPI003AF33262
MATMKTPRQLRNLDLNLLVALDALLDERNVSRAAERLGVAQPSASAALARLRRHFNDPLLRRNGNRYELTPLAANLRPLTATALVTVRRVFDAAPTFDPATADRTFTIVVSDYAVLRIGEPLARVLHDRAPGVQLRLEQNTPSVVDAAEDTLRTIDGIVIPYGFISRASYIEFPPDDWVCVCAADNPDMGDELTLDDLRRSPWVVTFHGPTAFTPALRQLQTLGVEPNIEVVMESFLAVPFLVTGTRRIALLQRSLAERLRPVADLRVLPCPGDVAPLRDAFWWDPIHDADPGHIWLREIIAEIAGVEPLS